MEIERSTNSLIENKDYGETINSLGQKNSSIKRAMESGRNPDVRRGLEEVFAKQGVGLLRADEFWRKKKALVKIKKTKEKNCQRIRSGFPVKACPRLRSGAGNDRAMTRG